MKKRIITGIILAAVLVLALYFGGLALAILVAIVASAGLWEFYGLFWKDHKHFSLRLLGIILGLGVIACFFVCNSSLSGMFGVLIVAFLVHLFAWIRNQTTRFEDTALLTAGLCYVPLMLLPVLNMSVYEQIFLVGVTAISDTAAYFAGVRFGKHKICPCVSPNKTVEGSAAGLIACIIWTISFGVAWGTASPAMYILAGAVLGIASQFGDLFESALKRACDVKDSGNLLPGHGGVLDRIDSLLFVIPTYAFAEMFIKLFR